MNSNDFSRLSYKELQALALRYRVPGNIKKKLLIKVLHAAKGGNENEVSRLLQDLKQNRKRKVRKIKIGKLGLTSTPLHSPNYVMADDYYCPQQQPPYQWVGAEEEIASRDDDNRIPHYEEFKQFLLKRIQREFQTYDTNNNQVQDSNIVDLRTATVSSDVQKVPLDATIYGRSNTIAVNSTDSFVYQPTDNVEYQTLEDPNSNVQGSILLKKMLQAPVGANLGEIASPVHGSYRYWTMEQYQPNDLLDNSDTLTAESDNQDNEENLENNTECYGLLGAIKGEYFLNEPTLVRNVDEIGQQISNVLTNENVNQYCYPTTNIDMHQDYENWTVTNVMDATDNNCATSDVQSSKVFHTMYYDNMGSDNLNKPIKDESLTCQYRITENVHPYNSNQNILNMNPPEENQYYETNIVPSVQSDCTNTYYLQNLIKSSTETNEVYLQNTHTFSNANTDQDTYTTSVSQTFSNNNHYNTDLPYEYPSSHNNQGNIPLNEHLKPHEQTCNSTEQTESSVHKNISNTSEKIQTNGILDPFLPRNVPNIPTDSILENILNLISTKRIDLSKLDQTSCVYCYIAPIVTHTPVLSNITCSQKERFVAEYRQHSFSPYWLLYNDTTSGMRMANLQTKVDESIVEEPRVLHTPISNSNSDLRDSIEESDDSITEVWTHNYSNYETIVEKDANMCEDLNIEATDCLFSVINTEPLVSQVDDLSKSQIQ
ncbi:hypothetical protein WH47_00703 [Habropoda laboriosa]|uniref:Uncharacterized protein n=1 Tax=Habropoda laboriosa TaxID=597456 RepID=A0A0L7QYE1_9HYME|nr:PREDICTED: putative uncharacterized protein DDB_G0282133 [Habropoda laboriosa]KOC63635.1 hypothetical protein WH47_00703 [Habropoda laboriosa]